MPSGRAVEFDLIRLKVREDDGGLQLLLHLRHGVNTLRGWREVALGHFSTSGTLEAFPLESDLLHGCGEQQPHYLPGKMLSIRVTENRPVVGRSPAHPTVMGMAMAFAHKTVSS